MATPIPDNRACFSLAEVARATRGAITRRGELSDELAVSAVSDSRAVKPHSLFVALVGEAHDGHSFIDAAAERGALIIVVERGRTPEPAPRRVSFVEVDDTLVAWGDLAGAHLVKWRSEALDGRVIAITGSAGKTTTKELTAALLSEVASTHYTAGNLNNRVGVPSVIFALTEDHRFCVLEMGMSLPGEIDAICSFAPPDVSVIVNIGVAHAEGVGGREGVMHEKAAVYRALGREGTAIVNADDEYVRRAAKGHRKVVTFGHGERSSGTLPPDAYAMIPNADGSASAMLRAVPMYRLVSRTPEDAGSRVTLACSGRELTLFLPIPGEAAAIDLAAALAAQEAASRELLPVETIESALAKVALEGRGTVRRRDADDVLILDDTYNANPSSMRVALSTLVELSHRDGRERRRVAVVGEMKELGALAIPEHESLGDAVADAGVDLIIGCGGELIARTLERARTRGVTEIVTASSSTDAAEEARARVRPGDAVLVKASRGVRAEAVVGALLNER